MWSGKAGEKEKVGEVKGVVGMVGMGIGDGGERKCLCLFGRVDGVHWKQRQQDGNFLIWAFKEHQRKRHSVDVGLFLLTD